MRGRGRLVYLDVFASKQELVTHLLTKQNNECYLCLEPFTKGNPPTVDHIYPLSRGGTWEVDNLALAHRVCNQQKDNRVFHDDGTLEPRKRAYKKNRYRNRSARNQICHKCLNGRWLDVHEVCPACNSSAGPAKNPWYLRSSPDTCDHGAFWCFSCACGWV